MVNLPYSPITDEMHGLSLSRLGIGLEEETGSISTSAVPMGGGRGMTIENSSPRISGEASALFTSSRSRPAGAYLPYLSTVLILSTMIVFYCTDSSDCSQPLTAWILGYMTRHVSKSILYDQRSRLTLLGRELPSYLVILLATVDLGGPLIWSLGGYYIFHTGSCDTGLFVYACFLWGLQSMGLLLPCCFLSTILFCAPCLLWLAPYIIRPNPNTIATGREVMSKLSKKRYSEIHDMNENSSCAICLSEYSLEDEIIKLPCGHLFHSVCIESWLSVSQLCPVDRSNVPETLKGSHSHTSFSVV